MMRIISQLFVLLDGVMKAPEEWHFPYCDNRMAEVVAEQIDGADILLLGRATYQIFAGSWPQRGDEVPLATRINAMPKLVVSTTLTSVAWQNTTVIAGDVPEELAKIKEQPGRNVTVSGGPTLVRSLPRNCLLDKLPLLVHRLVRGHGRRWLEDGLAQPPRTDRVTPGARDDVTGPEALSYRDIAAQAQQDARPRDHRPRRPPTTAAKRRQLELLGLREDVLARHVANQLGVQDTHMLLRVPPQLVVIVAPNDIPAHADDPQRHRQPPGQPAAIITRGR